MFAAPTQSAPLAIPVPVRARSSTPFFKEPRPSTLLSDRFFAPGSSACTFLNAYVRGKFKLPVTTTGSVKGLPRILQRGIVDTQDSGPSLLFLDLPDLPLNAGDPEPERYRSNVLLNVLERMQAQDLPVFGVSGCEKTHSMIEMLCLQWGFYFNSAKQDLGSNDLSQLAEFLDTKTSEERGPRFNTLFARNMTLVLFLSRLLVLKYCLQVSNCRRTFSSANWAKLQICLHLFKDAFSELFQVFFKHLHECDLFEIVVMTVIQDKFLEVRNLLATLNCPNFSVVSKLGLVVDEAQILGDTGHTKFQSSYTETDLRPMLSPSLTSSKKQEDQGELTIIYRGTGLSIHTCIEH
ncbi:hypothetical protein MVEG_10265 [Podila verticillata NRRL 6337]|nr:hypothetical protein MVEG_10265 [Podila verticillata NRRL 6337]